MRRTLTVDVHPDGLDGGRPQAVLSLAVVAPPLGPQDLCDVQRLVEHAGVLEAVRHAAGRLGPSDLETERTGFFGFLIFWMLVMFLGFGR